MARTTIGYNNRKKPAPRSYRKFENAYLMIILPAFTGAVQSWGLSDTICNRAMIVLGLSAAVVKATGFLLANGEEYAQSKPFNIGKVPMIIACMLFMVSCSTTNRFNRNKHFIEDHGGFVLPNKDSLAGTCAEKYPCVTTEKEVKDSGWTVFSGDNQTVIDSMKKVIDSIKSVVQKPPVINDSTSCMNAVMYYQAKMTEYGALVAGLTARIKNSSTEYRQRTEKLTVESTAKLAAKDVRINALDKRNYELNSSLDSVTSLLQLANTETKNHLQDHANISKTFKWFVGALWNAYWWLILMLGAGFGLYKFRKLIPLLKLIP